MLVKDFEFGKFQQQVLCAGILKTYCHFRAYALAFYCNDLAKAKSLVLYVLPDADTHQRQRCARGMRARGCNIFEFFQFRRGHRREYASLDLSSMDISSVPSP